MKIKSNKNTKIYLNKNITSLIIYLFFFSLILEKKYIQKALKVS